MTAPVATWFGRLQVDVGVPYLRDDGHWYVTVTDLLSRVQVRFRRPHASNAAASVVPECAALVERVRPGRRITLTRLATDAIRATAGGAPSTCSRGPA